MARAEVAHAQRHERQRHQGDQRQPRRRSTASPRSRRRTRGWCSPCTSRPARPSCGPRSGRWSRATSGRRCAAPGSSRAAAAAGGQKNALRMSYSTSRDAPIMMRRMRKRKTAPTSAMAMMIAGVAGELAARHAGGQVIDGEFQHPRRQQLDRRGRRRRRRARARTGAGSAARTAGDDGTTGPILHEYMCYSGSLFPASCQLLPGAGFHFQSSGARNLMRIRIVLSILCLAFVLAAVAGAGAIRCSSGRPNRATGENYRVEFGGYFWNPTPDHRDPERMRCGIIGDADRLRRGPRPREDPVLPDQGRAPPGEEAQVALRVHARSATSSQKASLRRNVIFNGHRSTTSRCRSRRRSKWNAYRFTYEYDFIYRDRGFFGILLEAKYTDVEATLLNVIDNEFVRARAPIPAIGAIGRVYVAPNISITGEFSGFRLPESIDEDYRGKLLRLRHLRHRQLQRPLRRPGRLPLLRRVLPGRPGRGDLKLRGLTSGGW